ncbi:MAG: radical SAM protein [Methanoculleus sp. SDB]|nr:MAG: radical SAM protein [Methanoculleus sp. SDB]
MGFQYLFGPVPSRRLGVSLGIDLVPFKTCSFNCIFCECGPTTDLTTERKEYVPTDDVIRELDTFLASHPHLDFITFSGSGEPTLHTGIGAIARHVKERFPGYRLALLTNSSLLSDAKVRNDILDIDVVIPSLNAVSERVFRKINRSHPSLSPDQITDGLIAFRSEYSGAIWLEIFIIPGLNDTPGELDLLKAALRKIRPDKVQLNTLDRPGVVDWVNPSPASDMERIARHLDYPGVEIITGAESRSEIPCFSADVLETILRTIRRRPCTMQDLARITGLHPDEITKYTGILRERNLILEKREERGIFYTCAP